MGGVNSDVVAFGTVKQGRVHLHNRRQFDQQVGQFRDGATVQLEVTIKRASRSLQQNSWYWGVIVELIAEYTGYTPDEVHEFLKAKFIPKRLAIADANGEVVDEYVLGGSTRKMNTLQFGEYCEQIRIWAAETLDVNIPDPEGR